MPTLLAVLLCTAFAADPVVRVGEERVPDPHRWLEKQGVDVYLSDRLQLKLPHRKKKYLSHWTQIADRFLQIVLNLHLWDIFNNLPVACICS